MSDRAELYYVPHEQTLLPLVRREQMLLEMLDAPENGLNAVPPSLICLSANTLNPEVLSCLFSCRGT